jgi:flagellar hook-associated protein 1 FlgK
MGMGGLSIGVTALQAQRQGLETAGQNIANANTEGYSRQRVRLESVGAPAVPAFHSKFTGTGSGVQVADIERASDRFLQIRTLQEHGTQASLEQTQSIVGRVEASFAEPSDNGLQEQMADFWSGFDDVANNPADLATRTALLQKAQTVTGSFNRIAGDLDSLKQTALDQANNDTGQINNIAARVAELNGAIQSATNGGLQPNDLLDQRDLLLQKLGTFVGVTTQQNNNGVVDVYVGSTALVRGRTSATMHVDNTSGTATFQWDADNSTVAVTGGQDGGLLQAINVDIPKYRNLLNGVATSFRDAVNQQHEAGVDLNSAPNATASGRDLLNPPGVASGTVDAALLQVNPNLTADQVAAASVNGGRLDGSNALKLAELANSPTGPDQAYRSLIDTLGVDGQRINTQVNIQTEITSQTDAAAQSVTGVNMDEEMTNLMSFQHAYEAAAKYISVIDSTLETLINLAN